MTADCAPCSCVLCSQHTCTGQYAARPFCAFPCCAAPFCAVLCCAGLCCACSLLKWQILQQQPQGLHLVALHSQDTVCLQATAGGHLPAVAAVPVCAVSVLCLSAKGRNSSNVVHVQQHCTKDPLRVTSLEKAKCHTNRMIKPNFCLQETGGGHLPGAAAVLAQLVVCGQSQVDDQIQSRQFVARLVSASLRYPCANPLQCATLQLVR